MSSTKSKDLILSVCLSTYNQPDSVDRFLKDFSEESLEGAEILIKDDSPNDDTKKIVEKHSSDFPAPIKYFKGEKVAKGGYDIALLFLTKEAQGRYVWWFGDDVIKRGVVKRIIDFVNNHPDISFLWLNSQDIENENSVSMRFGGDKFFKDHNEVFATNVGLLGFPTATILKREKALMNIDGADKFIGTTLTGYYLVLSVLTQDGKFCFLEDPAFFSNPKPSGEVRWYDSFQVHAVNYYVIAQEFKDKFDRRALRKGLADQYGRIWRAVVVERAMGLTTGFGSKSPKVLKMAKLYWSYPEFYIALLLFLTPRPILKIFYKLYRFLFRRGGK